MKTKVVAMAVFKWRRQCLILLWTISEGITKHERFI